MRCTTLPRKALLAMTLAACFSGAHATNGYFAHGYGVKAQGMGGAAVAMTDNAFAGANNPATAAFAGNRWEVGATLFSPRRSMSRDALLNGAPSASIDSEKEVFLVPEFAYNKIHSENVALNLTVYGNGGMNTQYPLFAGYGPANPLFGTTKLGVDLSQLIIAPTIAYKPTQESALGVSPLLVYQRFKAYGLQLFDQQLGANTGTNDGYDSSTGIGVRIGYFANLNGSVSVGASYAPKINMAKFDKYAGLFAGGGDFDIPENYTVGFSVKASPTVQVAIDYQRINYGGVASVNDPSTNLGACFQGDRNSCLGGSRGPGFGWKDINVYKLGVQWQASPTWTLRAGYNKGDNPISARDVTFNILAPGVMEDHYTFGATISTNKTDEVSFFFMYAPQVSVSGASLLGALDPGAFGGVNETIRMKQYSGGIQFSRKF